MPPSLDHSIGIDEADENTSNNFLLAGNKINDYTSIPQDSLTNSGRSRVRNYSFWAVNYHNSLLKHLTNTKLSESRISLSFMDNISQANFFATCKKTYQFPLTAHLSTINHFLTDLKKETDAKSIVSNRTLNNWSLGSIGVFSLCLGLAIYCGIERNDMAVAVRDILSLMNNTLYTPDPSVNCASFTIIADGFNRCSSTRVTDFANCTDLCNDLNDYSQRWFSFNLGFTATIILDCCILLFARFTYNCIKMSNHESHIRLTLHDYSQDLQQRGEALFLTLSEIKGIKHRFLTIDSRVEGIQNYLTSISENRALPLNLIDNSEVFQPQIKP